MRPSGWLSEPKKPTTDSGRDWLVHRDDADVDDDTQVDVNDDAEVHDDDASLEPVCDGTSGMKPGITPTNVSESCCGD